MLGTAHTSSSRERLHAVTMSEVSVIRFTKTRLPLLHCLLSRRRGCPKFSQDVEKADDCHERERHDKYRGGTNLQARRITREIHHRTRPASRATAGTTASSTSTTLCNLSLSSNCGSSRGFAGCR